ncbi:MAG TPA: 3-isopropylmalate dehydratase small subunit [Candidatus Binataceae bacterium]|nr:3-isopropylmalate dehydratase small subunit [Candidatus Binataceae bacterium]
MEPFGRLDAVATPLLIANVDTDQIIPARFLARARADGFGDVLFHDLRFTRDGAARTDFALNDPKYGSPKILVAEANFGCGSSREHAVWALVDFGFRAVIAPSFGDIFRNNSYKNGLLAVSLPSARIAALQKLLRERPGVSIQIDLPAQRMFAPDGIVNDFSIDPFRKMLLIEGVEEINFTLGLRGRIAEFERAYESKFPWAAGWGNR